jgi:putative transposase
MGCAAWATHSLTHLDGLYSQFDGREHTIARPMLTADDRLIVPVPGTGTAAVVTLADSFLTSAFTMTEPTLLCDFHTVPGRSVLMQSNCDGQFFVFDAGKAKAPILSGRVVADELILYNAQGYYAATYEGAHFVHIAFPGRGGVHSFEQFARTLQRHDLIKTILEGGPATFAAPELSPPPELTFSAAPRGSLEISARIKAHSDVGLATVAFYEDGRLFQEMPLSGHQARLAHAPRTERYPGDVTDAEWALIAPMLAAPRRGGRPRATDMREVFNAVRYVLRTGCQWLQLPKDFPPRSTVYNSLWEWTRYGVLDRIHPALLVACREAEGREALADRRHHRHADGESHGKRGPSADPVGYDAGKKTKDIKRNALVDTIGLLLGIEVIPASVQDLDCAADLIARTRRLFPFIARIFADGGYAGSKLEADLAAQPVTIEIVKRTDKEAGFKVVRRRWVARAHRLMAAPQSPAHGAR